MAALGISVNNDIVYAHIAQWLASELFRYQYIKVQRETNANDIIRIKMSNFWVVFFILYTCTSWLTCYDI